MFLGYIHFWSFTFFLLGDFITQSTTYIAWLCDKAWCMSLLITLALVWGKGLHSSAGRNVKLLFKECFLPCMNISNDMDEHSLTILVLIDYITVVLFCFVFFFILIIIYVECTVFELTLVYFTAGIMWQSSVQQLLLVSCLRVLCTDGLSVGCYISGMWICFFKDCMLFIISSTVCSLFNRWSSC